MRSDTVEFTTVLVVKMLCSLRLVRAPPMTPLVTEAPRLFLLVQVGDL